MLDSKRKAAHCSGLRWIWPAAERFRLVDEWQGLPENRLRFDMKMNLDFWKSITGVLVVSFLVGCARERQPILEPKPVLFGTVLDARVLRLLKSDPQLRRFDIKVNTFQGHVMLDGVVDSEEQRAQAAKLAWGVSGVTGLDNNILLKSETGP